jgi:hypothetical protein
MRMRPGQTRLNDRGGHMGRRVVPTKYVQVAALCGIILLLLPQPKRSTDTCGALFWPVGEARVCSWNHDWT